MLIFRTLSPGDDRFPQNSYSFVKTYTQSFSFLAVVAIVGLHGRTDQHAEITKLLSSL